MCHPQICGDDSDDLLQTFSIDLTKLDENQNKEIQNWVKDLKNGFLCYQSKSIETDKIVISISKSKNQDLIPKLDLQNRTQKFFDLEKMNFLREKVKSSECPSKEFEEKTIQFLDKIIDSFDFLCMQIEEIPKDNDNVVLSHNDLNRFNFLIDKSKKVYIIDHEFTGINYIYFDLAATLFLCNLSIDFQKLKVNRINVYDKHVKRVVEVYLEERQLSIPIDTMLDRVLLFRLVHMWFWLYLFGIVMFELKRDLLFEYFLVIIEEFDDVFQLLMSKVGDK